MAFFGRNEATKNPLPRRVFFGTLVCTYFMITSAILFMTLGYRYSFSDGIFLYTGSVNFKSQPRNVNITIDGEEPPIQHVRNFINDSRHITGIRPGMHVVGAETPGYLPWSKEIRIRSGLATEFWNVLLLQESYVRSSLPVLNAKRLFFAPNMKTLAYPQKDPSDTSLYIPLVNTVSEEVSQTHVVEYALFSDELKENIEWSPNINYIATPIQRLAKLPHEKEGAEKPNSLLANELLTESVDESDVELLDQPQKDYVIIDNSRENIEDESLLPEHLYLSSIISNYEIEKRSLDVVPIKDLSALDTEEIEQESEILPAIEDVEISPRMVRWHPNEENTLLTLHGKELLSIFIDDDSTTTVEFLSDEVIAYDFADDGIYVLSVSGALSWIKNFNFEDPEILSAIPSVEQSDRYRVIAYDNSRVMVIDDTRGSLAIFNNFEDQVVMRSMVDEGLRGAQFSDDGKKIVYHTDRFVSVYFTRDWLAQPQREANSVYTIMESDADIQTVEWTPDYEHFIASVGGELFLAELDDRGSYRVEGFLNRSLADKNVIMDQQEYRLYFTDIGEVTESVEGSADKFEELFYITFPHEKPGIFQ